MQRALSYDQAPPLPVALKFFLGAPLFLFAASLLLLWHGPAAIESRWSPVTLALTHLLTLGFVSMAMIGALLHILPVVIGVTLPVRRLTASVLHAALTAGTLSLAGAFLSSQAVLFRLALALLVPTFLWLLGCLTIALSRKALPKPEATTASIRLAVMALAVTILLGASMAGALAWGYPVPFMLLTDLHVLWGLGGWVGLVIIGVAFQLVPMFQVTQVYPMDIKRLLSGSLFLLLVLWSTEAILEAPVVTRVLSAAMFLTLASFAIATLYLLNRKKRAKPDASAPFWRLSMTSLLLCGVVWATQFATGDHPPVLTLGVLFIVGFAGTLINGMLYKIVPFLIWYHAQLNARPGVRTIPGVRDLVPDHATAGQFRAHLVALLLLTAATVLPDMLARPAAIAMCISSGWLLHNLLRAVRVFTRSEQNALAVISP